MFSLVCNLLHQLYCDVELGRDLDHFGCISDSSLNFDKFIALLSFSYLPL